MKTNRSTLFFLLLVVLFGCQDANPPSETVNEYLERPEIKQELSVIYFYPSTVRMLNKVLTNGGENLLEGVEEGRLAFGGSDSLDVFQRDMSEIKTSLNEEGFEFLAEMRSGSVLTLAYVREAKPNRYVALLGEKGSTMLIELKGEISMESIQGLSKLNSDNVLSLLGRGDIEDEINEFESEESAPDSIKNSESE